MRNAIVITVLTLAIGVLAPTGAVAKAGGTDRPIKDHWAGSTVVSLADLSFSMDVTGTGSHLGRTTSHVGGAVTPTGANSFSLGGTATVVAANGDKLHGTLSGNGAPDAAGNLQGQATITFTGGTGRFENATGSYTGPFSQVLIGADATTATYTTTYSPKGRISY